MKTTSPAPMLTRAAAIAAMISCVLWPARSPAQVTFTNLHSFSVFPDGVRPQTLALGSDGNFYGTATVGGVAGGLGTVFKATSNGVVTVIHSFSGGSEGAMPQAGLIQDSDGSFYGTAASGGANGVGTVFKITTNGTMTTLYSFTNGIDGSHPYAALVQGNDGNLYGTAAEGGINGYGTAFKITTNGALTSLHSFNNTGDGSFPLAALVPANDGSFYGTTFDGGVSGPGTIFKITTNGALTSLYSFLDGNDGANPGAALVKGSDGSLYGSTANAGANSYSVGTIFKITTNGAFTSLYSFTDGIDGAGPEAALVQGSDGSLYGTTTYRGADYGGTIFKITTNGTLTPMYSFTGGIDGGSSTAALTLGNDGQYYGTTTEGGVGIEPGGNGTLFKITTNAVFTRMFSFPGVNDGQTSSALVHASDGSFYGTTQAGGTNEGNGNVFKVTTNGILTSLYSFTGGNDGSTPVAPLIQGADGSLYGTTSSAGTAGAGTVFKITTNGLLTTLYSFTGGVDGGAPNTPLVLGKDGNYYGTTSSAGNSSGNGTIFQLTPDGCNTLYSFTGSQVNGGAGDGDSPSGLVVGSDGNLYGTTADGGINSAGAIFAITSGGTLDVLYSFTGGNDGASPPTPLTLGKYGVFYGTTSLTTVNATIFAITTNGILTTIYSFEGLADGDAPSALLAGADGNLYGTTSDGGTNYSGAVFVVNPEGALTNLYSFTGGFDGGSPTALAQGADGSLFGTTSSGAVGGFGGVFRLSGSGLPSPLPRITAQPTNPPSTLEGLSATLSVGAIGAMPLSYQWSLNSVPLSADGDASGVNSSVLTIDPATAEDAGTYSVTVSNSYGVASSSSAVVSLFAPTNIAEDFTAGTNYLATADFALANLSFSNALNASPTNAIYDFFYAASQLLSLPQQPAGSNFLNLLGYGEMGRDPLKWEAKLAQKVPAGVNADQFTAQLRTNVLSAVIAAQADLAAVTDTNFTVNVSSAETLGAAVTVDWGDVQLLRSMCEAGELFIYTTYSWNLNAQLTDVSNILETTGKSYQTLLADYPSALTTTSTADLPLAKGAFTNAILDYFAASQFIRSRPAGEVRLFNIDTNRIEDEFKFRETLSNLLASLNGPVPLTLNPADSVSAQAFFSGNLDLRSYLPMFQGADFIWNSFPDATFGGVFTGFTEQQLERAWVSHDESVLALPGASLVVLYDFTNFLNQTGVVEGHDGNFYGALTTGGPYVGYDPYGLGFGSIFQITTSGQFNVLYNFGMLTDAFGNIVDGTYPNPLTSGSDGNFYGTTSTGGQFGSGTFFRIDSSSRYTNLYSFGTINDQFASFPNAGLIEGADGKFYGVTQMGGNAGYGTVFAVTTNGVCSCLSSFNANEGEYPSTPLMQGHDGNLYGTTPAGGPFGYGTIFRVVASSGQVNLLYSFGTVQDAYGDSLDGNLPSGLVQGADGNLYGTTQYGGPNYGWGSVFRISPTVTNSFASLYSFDGKFPTGYSPIGSMVPGPDGSFYGITSGGGANDKGGVFIFKTNGPATNLLWFTETSGGYRFNLQSLDNVPFMLGEFYPAYPSLLIAGTGGNLIGTTTDGGTNGDGTVYSLAISSGVVTPPAPIIQAATRSGQTIHFTWSTTPGYIYQVQYKTNLTQSVWANFGSQTNAVGTTVSASDPVTNTRRFYRVELLP